MNEVIDATFHKIIFTLLLIALYPLCICIYNITLHPLAKFPGPLLWRASRLPNLRATWSGRHPYIVEKLHRQYGEVVRISPNELSVAHPAAWNDIYSNRGGTNPHAFPKSHIWHGSIGDSASSVFTRIDLKDHARIRRYLDPAFAERALLRQESILHEYVDRCIQKLRDRLSVQADGRTTVNIIDWLNFAMFDIIGDLAFGESFNCLDKCEYEDWMSNMFGAIKANYLIISIRHWPLLFNFLMRMVPRSAKQQQQDHHNRAAVKVMRRLEGPSDKPDIVSQMQRSEDGKDGLTLEEILENSKLFIVAGSETTVTVLTGTINYLINNPSTLSRLQRELRQLQHPEDLTLTALKRLSYLEAVLREGLRLCNPNLIGHMRISPPEGGFVAGRYIPGNTIITIHHYTLTNSEKYFADASSWRPERWLDQAKTDVTSPYFADARDCVRAFGWGPQMCIGEPLAWAEMRLMLGKLVWAFGMEKATTSNGNLVWSEQQVFAVVDKHPLDVTLSEGRQ